MSKRTGAALLIWVAFVFLFTACTAEKAWEDKQESMDDHALYTAGYEPVQSDVHETQIPITARYGDDAVTEEYVVVASYESRADEKSYVHIFLQESEPLYDILISSVYSHRDDSGDIQYSLETEGLLYVPALSPGQAIKMDTAALPRDNSVRIAYANSRGEYEGVLLAYDLDMDLPLLIPMEDNLGSLLYEESLLDWEYAFPGDFKAAVLQGVFDSHIPKGFRIMGGSLGDVNGDGLQDAVLMLATGGKRVAAYSGVAPMVILLGQEDGTYALAGCNASALFVPVRSSSRAVAGQGYIDMEYSFTGGAAHHSLVSARFHYDGGSEDWLLGEFYSARMNYNFASPAFVSALPSFSGLSIADFTGNEFDVQPDFALFDEVVEINVPVTSGAASELLCNTFAIGVNVNEAQGCYEGYIYKHWARIDSDSFQGTIRGEYSAVGPHGILVDPDNVAFRIQNDWYVYDEQLEDFFYEE